MSNTFEEELAVFRERQQEFGYENPTLHEYIIDRAREIWLACDKYEIKHPLFLADEEDGICLYWTHSHISMFPEPDESGKIGFAYDLGLRPTKTNKTFEFHEIELPQDLDLAMEMIRKHLLQFKQKSTLKQD